MEFGRQELNFNAAAILAGKRGLASVGFILAIARATGSVLVARTDVEKSSQRVEARPDWARARSSDADASPPARGHTRTWFSPSATIGSERPSTKASRSRTFASLASARRDRVQPLLKDSRTARIWDKVNQCGSDRAGEASVDISAWLHSLGMRRYEPRSTAPWRLPRCRASSAARDRASTAPAPCRCRGFRRRIHPFGGGKGSPTGSGLSFARIAFNASCW